jgi:hypothetical protein
LNESSKILQCIRFLSLHSYLRKEREDDLSIQKEALDLYKHEKEREKQEKERGIEEGEEGSEEIARQDGETGENEESE